MMTDLVSVIIPSYRGEDHVGRMIHDVLKQTYRNLEVLVVGNGPDQDAQRKLVEEIAANDARVHYLSIPKAGVSGARNVGIDNAKGDWIAFVDDDDRVPEDWLSRFAAHFAKKPDMIGGGITCLGFGAAQPSVSDVQVSAEGVFSRDRYEFLRVFASDVAVRYSPCSKVVRRAFLNAHNIRFDETLTVCEDCVFSQRIALAARSMCFIPQTGYLYVARGGSAAYRYHESMEAALKVRRSLLVRVAERGGLKGEGLVKFHADQLVADSLDVFLNAFRKGTPFSFGRRLELLSRLFADVEFAQAARELSPPRDNLPLFIYLWMFRLHAKAMGVTLFTFLFAVREWKRRLA